jgi:hypothetical protein
MASMRTHACVLSAEMISQALTRIVESFPTFSGGLVCLSSDGEYGGATHNMGFSYSVANADNVGVQVVSATSV